MKVIEKMSGRKIIRPEISGEKLAEKQDKAYEDRLEELRYKAISRLAGQGLFWRDIEITQIGCEGFYWKHEGSIIPKFERWGLRTRCENRRIFNAHT